VGLPRSRHLAAGRVPPFFGASGRVGSHTLIVWSAPSSGASSSHGTRSAILRAWAASS